MMKVNLHTNERKKFKKGGHKNKRRDLGNVLVDAHGMYHIAERGASSRQSERSEARF